MTTDTPVTSLTPQGNTSPIGRLLEEISWESAASYRHGGAGLENVLTTEVMLPLSYLPRDHFLGEVLRSAHVAPEAAAALDRGAREAELLQLSMLPPELSLPPGAVRIQPDATLETSDSYVLVEAKRAGRALFGPEQLAKEYLAVLQEAGDRVPLLLLILGEAPPIRVKGRGLREVAEALIEQLPRVLAQVDPHPAPLGELIRRIPEVVAWTTWREIGQTVARQAGTLRVENSSVQATLSRLVAAIQTAIDTHRAS